jgi:hypothetical protein
LSIRRDAADQPSWQCAGGKALAVRNLSGDHRSNITSCPLTEALSALGQIPDDLRAPYGEALDVDDVHIGSVTRGDNATIVQADGARWLGSQLLDDVFDGYMATACA